MLFFYVLLLNRFTVKELERSVTAEVGGEKQKNDQSDRKTEGEGEKGRERDSILEN